VLGRGKHALAGCLGWGCLTSLYFVVGKLVAELAWLASLHCANLIRQTSIGVHVLCSLFWRDCFPVCPLALSSKQSINGFLKCFVPFFVCSCNLWMWFAELCSVSSWLVSWDTITFQRLAKVVHNSEVYYNIALWVSLRNVLSRIHVQLHSQT